MERRTFVACVSGVWLTTRLPAMAQQGAKIWRVGMLETTSAELNAANLDALREGLRDLGYIEGRNLSIEYRSADGRGERFTDLAAELVGLKVDLIIARGTPAALAIKKATRTLPVIIVSIADPLDIVPSLSHPGGNITGLSNQTRDSEAKRIELLRAFVPRLARIAVLYNMSNPSYGGRWDEFQRVSKSMGLQPQLLDGRKSEDLERLFADAEKLRVDGVMVAADGLFAANRKLIAGLAAKHKMPAIYQAREFVEAGGLMAYGPSYPDLYRRAAGYVDKIFKGANPGDLPFQQPTKFELIINAKVAKALGLTIPQSLLVRADEVVQ